MRKYRCYFIDEGAATVAWRPLERDALEAAQQHALGLLPGYPPAMIVEMWEGADLTFRYSRLETAQTPSELRRLCSLALDAGEEEIDVTLKRAIAWGAASLASQAEVLESQAPMPDQAAPESAAKT
jgi:hypothetical protein